jgi:hypothetical protein
MFRRDRGARARSDTGSNQGAKYDAHRPAHESDDRPRTGTRRGAPGGTIRFIRAAAAQNGRDQSKDR